MKIIALPDLHEGGIKHLDSIAEALTAVDLVLLPGDLTTRGGRDSAAAVVDAIRQYNTSILAVPGNWDGPAVDAYLTAEGINLHRRHQIIDQIAFFGVGGSIPSPVPGPNEYPEADFAAFLQDAVAGMDNTLLKILVCHQPPYNTTADKARSDLHVGSIAIRTFIETVQPAICFCGHIHEGVGIDSIGKTQIVNPGPIWNRRYAYAEIVDQQVVLVDLHAV